jgi:salicylate hydroxylase/6-hydroxynicotinate 3-monooxygenase
MTPFMAQGAAQGIEDAIVLSRCLQGIGREGIAAALSRYQRNRQPRATRVQKTSHENQFLKTQQDANWVYGYDAWTVALE